MYLRLTGQIESQLRDAYDKKHSEAGLTQTQIAEMLSVDRSAINHRLRGLTNMTIKTVADMVWVLGHDIDVCIYDPRERRDNHPPITSDSDTGRSESEDIKLLKAPAFDSTAKHVWLRREEREPA